MHFKELCMTMFCLKFVRFMIYFWLPLYLKKVLGYTNLQSGFLSTMFDIGTVLFYIILVFKGTIHREIFREREVGMHVNKVSKIKIGNIIHSLSSFSLPTLLLSLFFWGIIVKFSDLVHFLVKCCLWGLL